MRTISMPLQAEGRRFLAALERAALAKGSPAFAVSELYTLADRIELQLEVRTLLDDLREAGVAFFASLSTPLQSPLRGVVVLLPRHRHAVPPSCSWRCKRGVQGCHSFSPPLVLLINLQRGVQATAHGGDGAACPSV